jgi:hypothetical protein
VKEGMEKRAEDFESLCNLITFAMAKFWVAGFINGAVKILAA